MNPFPFANLEFPKGVKKNHNLQNQVKPKTINNRQKIEHLLKTGVLCELLKSSMVIAIKTPRNGRAEKCTFSARFFAHFLL
jgi:hypothetical protein